MPVFCAIQMCALSMRANVHMHLRNRRNAEGESCGPVTMKNEEHSTAVYRLDGALKRQPAALAADGGAAMGAAKTTLSWSPVARFARRRALGGRELM